MKVFYKIAWICLILSISVHILAVLNADTILEDIEPFAFLLHGGAIFLWLPVMFCMIISSDGTRNNLWGKSLANCPGWLKKQILCFALYGAANFIYCFLSSELHEENVSAVLKFFSGAWMFIFSLEIGIYKSFLNSENQKYLDTSFSIKRTAKIVGIVAMVILLLVALLIFCITYDHMALLGMIFISGNLLSFLGMIIFGIYAMINSSYLKKHYPDLSKRSCLGPYSERMAALKEIRQLDDPALKKQKQILCRILWSLLMFWLFVIVPTMCVLCFVFKPETT